MSLYTPIFPPLSDPKRFLSQSSASSSLVGGSRQPQVSVSDRLRDQHLALGSVPAIICPPSPTPEADIQRFDKLVKEIRGAADAAQGQPSNGRWAHVHTLTQLSCSESYWRGFGRRAPQQLDNYLEYLLPETEGEFMEWAEQQGVRRREAKRRCEAMTERELEEQLAQGPDHKAHAKAYAKVTKWQADIVPTSQPSDAPSKPKGLAGTSPLGPLAPKVRASTAAASKGKEKATSSPAIVSRFFVPHPPAEQPGLSDPEPPVQLSDPPQALRISPDEAAVPLPAPERLDRPRISEVSETFLPPSFNNIVTSTPTAEKLPLKTKPPTIPLVPGLFFASPPHEPAPFLPSQAVQSVPRPSTPPASKRPLAQLSPMEDSFDRELYGPIHPAKKPRSEPEPEPVPAIAPASISSSPPRTSLPALSQCSTTSTPPGLGNAHGPPPRTPEHSDARKLLATSHRPQPRLRPPSRRQSVSIRSAAPSNRGADDAPQTPPRASPTRTFFSSPASGSSSGSRAPALSSPVSPLFTREAACPPAQQKEGALVDMGYNSQFDVEGQVERVSAILEQDIDFDQWLRKSAAPDDSG